MFIPESRVQMDRALVSKKGRNCTIEQRLDTKKCAIDNFPKEHEMFMKAVDWSTIQF